MPAARTDRRTLLPRRKRWRIVLVAALLLVVGATALVGRLLSGPLFTEIGTDRIAAAMAAAAGDDVRVSVGVVGLGLGEDFRPVVHLRDVVIDRPDANGSLDTLEFLTSWGTLLGLERHITHVTSDHVFIETAAAGGPMPTLPDLVASLDEGLRAARLSSLDVGALTLRRRTDDGRRATVLDEAAVTAERLADDRLTARLAGAGVNGPWTVSATVGPGEGDTVRLVHLETEGFDLRDLGAMAAAPVAPAAAAAAADPAALAATALPGGGEVEPGDVAAAGGPTGPAAFKGRIGFSATGRIVEGEGELTVGPIRAGEATGALVLDRSRLAVRWRPEDRSVVVDPSPIVLPSAHAVISGVVGMPPPDATAWPFRFNVVAKDRETTRDRALGLLEGSYDPADRTFVVDTFRAEGEGTTFAAAMRLTESDGHLFGALSGVFPSMSVDTLKTIWPPVVVHEARNWVHEHVIAGTIRDATVDLAVSDDSIDHATGDAASAAVSFRFEDLAFRPLDDGGPVIRQAFGTGRLVDDRFEVAMERGVVDIGDGRTLAIAGATFAIPTVAKDPPDGEISIDLAGDAAAAVALWEVLPLSDGVDLPAGPGDVSGQARARIRVDLPLVKDVPADLVTYGGEIVLEGLASKVPIEGRAISDGAITIAIAEGAATVSGTAKVDGVAAEVDIVRPLAGGGGGSSAVKLVLGDKERRTLGIDLGRAVRGPVTVSLMDEALADGTTVKRATVDLARADISFAPVGFRKAKGVPGTARFIIRETEGRTRIDDIAIEMGDARIEGALVLDKAGGLVSGDLPVVRLARSDRLAVSLSRKGEFIAAKITGSRFDARGLITRQMKAAEDDGGPVGKSIELDIGVGTVLGFGEEELAGVNIASRIEGGVTTAMSFAAQTAGGGTASATVTPAGAVRQIQIEAGEVGRLLRFLDLYPRVFGGRARVAGTIDRAGVVRARVDGSRWRIVEEPALARLSTAATQGPTAGFSTAEIERLLLDLELGAGRLVIADGIVRADTAGLTLQGDVDFRRDTLRLAGSYLPAGELDSLIGRIPILGQTLFAGGRAGLFGVTFRLNGPIHDPNLTVNPLSIIAPGIFRKIFELG
ncbi:hypothetical protein [Mongoliimonas terrestris]|uniref:hypothetical protein n=1 Tax=Mongoliimonas terrestris TaxID=1709001 RepID=UPI000949902C|nr:hypothetical protein [Mongoliimonas terrestris]